MNNSANALSLTELRIVAKRILDHLELSGVDFLRVDHDFYWTIPPETRYDRHIEPSEFTLGQLSDDTAELRRIAHGEVDVTSADVARLGILLEYLGDGP